MALWLRPQPANPLPAQIAGFFDRSDYTSPGRRPRPIPGNVSLPGVDIADVQRCAAIRSHLLCRRWLALGGEIWMDVKSRLPH
jgi:hypothetical protein